MIKIKSKKPQDVIGYQIQCADYHMCPICYGCRSYDPSYYKCIKLCGNNLKNNVCNIKKHKDDLIVKMLTKTTINIGDLINDNR